MIIIILLLLFCAFACSNAFALSPASVAGGSTWSPGSCRSGRRVLTLHVSRPEEAGASILSQPARKREHTLTAVISTGMDADLTTTPNYDPDSIRTPLPPTTTTLVPSVPGPLSLPVLSAALLITGNTIGAGCLVLPEVAAGPGLASSSVVFVAAYVMNLISGLAIAEVAIRQREQSLNAEVPSSFKELAEVNLRRTLIPPSAVSAISLFVNSCVMAFGLARAGEVGSSLLREIGGWGSLVSSDPTSISMGCAVLLAILLSTQTSSKLSNIASICVTGLFVSFGGLLLPGLAAVQNPVATLLRPGLDVAPGGDAADAMMSSVLHASPVFLTSLVYQNIVPSVTKLLDYDRTKTATSIALGSFLPLVMYLAWCYTCLGGGVDMHSATGCGGDRLMTFFSMATLAGSLIACGMSLSEEFGNFFKRNNSAVGAVDKQVPIDEGYQIHAVLMSVFLPLAAALALSRGQDFTSALRLAGSFGSPVLYGTVPAVMAWRQRQNSLVRQQDMVPTQMLGVLGLASAGFVGGELSEHFRAAVGLFS